MLETEISWSETLYKIDLKFGVVCLILQYLLLILLCIEFYSSFALGGSGGFGISSTIIFLSCRRNHKKFRQEKLIKESWWKLKEYGGWI